jgi:hypothetical protein
LLVCCSAAVRTQGDEPPEAGVLGICRRLRQLQGTNLNGADALRTLRLAAGHIMPIDQIAELHDDIKAGLDLTTEFRCPACGSLAFRYPRVLDDDKPVLCAGCGTFVSTYGELRHRLGEKDESRFTILPSIRWFAPLRVVQQVDGTGRGSRQTPRIRRTRRDPLHPLPDRRSPESRKQDK